MEIIGGRSKFTNIPAPIGTKVLGKVVELKLSEKIEDYISISVEFPQITKKSEDGKKTFTKRAFYGIPVDWSEKNKAGRLYKSLTGNFPKPDEQVNWTQLLMGRNIACIFEVVLDDQTGEPKGDKISWMGAPTATPTGETPAKKHNPELEPDEEIPF